MDRKARNLYDSFPTILSDVDSSQHDLSILADPRADRAKRIPHVP